jgi:hypothetical protein
MRSRPSSLLVALAIVLAGCATVSEPPCGPGQESAVSELLYFGTARPGGVVTPEEWAQFLGDTVTPRFPQGLTAWQASGQWKSAQGTIAREASHVLNLVHPDDAASEKAIGEIVAAYKSRFRQESVLRVRGRACASF